MAWPSEMTVSCQLQGASLPRQPAEEQMLRLPRALQTVGRRRASQCDPVGIACRPVDCRGVRLGQIPDWKHIPQQLDEVFAGFFVFCFFFSFLTRPSEVRVAMLLVAGGGGRQGVGVRGGEGCQSQTE